MGSEQQTTPERRKAAHGLSLAPMRGLRPAVEPGRLGQLLCPPYDVISETDRSALLAADPDNAVGVILPRAGEQASASEAGTDDPYIRAAARLDSWVSTGLYRVDPTPTLYVYEMRTANGVTTRGLVGALELRDPSDGVVLPHENTMAGPVADRLALMRATTADLEPIYLVYDGGGAASQVVADASDADLLATALTPDQTTHRLWGITDPHVHSAVEDDLSTRHALIADGHHRYATYRELQRELRISAGPGPWDRGLALLVDSSAYGPQVHAIHRVLVGLPMGDALERARPVASVAAVDSAEAGLAELDREAGFAAVLTDGVTSAVVHDLDPALLAGLRIDDEPAELTGLDVTILHRGLVERVWAMPDTVDTVGYAHSVTEAVAEASRSGGTAVLLRPTPTAAVAAIAAAGARMPRKSTLFTPKPASGLVIRRFADQR